MGKKDKAEELVKRLQSIEPLEDVPADVSVRFQETLARLALKESQAKSKKKWLSGGNQFALAASFTLVFALGAIFTLNSGDSSSTSLNGEQGSSIVDEKSSGIKDDQLLYSGGANSAPKGSEAPIRETNYSHDYSEIPSGLIQKFSVGSSWNSVEGLSGSSLKCLNALELSTNINLIDSGRYKGVQIKAFWSPLTKSSWNVYIVDSKCNVLEKKYVQN
jgi:hypothetical protein